MHATVSFDNSASFAAHYCRLAQWPLALRRLYLAEASARVQRGDGLPHALVPLLLAECDAEAVYALMDCWYAGAVRERGLQAAREQALDWLARGLPSCPTAIAARLCADSDEVLSERVEALVPGSLAAALNDPLRSPTALSRPAGSAPATRSGRAPVRPAASRTRLNARPPAARSCASR